MARSNGQLTTNDGRANLRRAFKASGCVICGRRYPELDWSELHIDHIDPRDKPRGESTLSGQGGGGGGQAARRDTASLLAELLVCQVLCVDCHKAKTRNGGGPAEEQLALFAGSGAWTYNGNGGD